jgi:hypothetical protein
MDRKSIQVLCTAVRWVHCLVILGVAEDLTPLEA